MTYTYPGNELPTLQNVSIEVSLLSGSLPTWVEHVGRSSGGDWAQRRRQIDHDQGEILMTVAYLIEVRRR